RLGELVLEVGAGRDGKDIIQLLEGALLRLRDEEEDEHKSREVQAGVEAECPHGVEGPEEPREGDGEDGGPEETGGHGPCHADLAVRERENFGGVGKGDGAFAGGVEGGEEEDEKGNHAQMGSGIFRDEKAEAGSQQRPSHVGKGEEQEGASAPGIDGPDGGPGKDEIHETETKGGEQGFEVPRARFDEDGGGIKGDDVDAAHLLGQHDGEGCSRRPADARDGEEFDEAGEIITATDDIGFFLDLRMDIVEVPSGLERGVAETAEGAEGFGVETLFNIPPRGFRAEVDAHQEREGGDHGGAELETPADGDDVIDGQIGAEAQKNAKRRPHLPAHDQATADSGGAVFRSVDGHGGGFTSHPDAQEETSDEELFPVLRDRGANDRKEAEDGREEDGPAAANIMIERVRAPAAPRWNPQSVPMMTFSDLRKKTLPVQTPKKKKKEKKPGNPQKGRADIGPGVDDTNNPGILLIIHARHAAGLGRDIGDAKIDGPGQVGTVGAGLIPALHGSANGTEDDGEVEGKGLAPFVEDLIAESVPFDLVEIGDLLEGRGVLGDEGALFEEWNHLLQIRFLGELLDIVEESVAGDASERILNSGNGLWCTLDLLHFLLVGGPVSLWRAPRWNRLAYRAVTLRFKLTDCEREPCLSRSYSPELVADHVSAPIRPGEM
ncbi:MAG: hypothetical protein Q9163_004976, partial [Psora crenata]